MLEKMWNHWCIGWQYYFSLPSNSWKKALYAFSLVILPLIFSLIVLLIMQ